ncbi:(5-formylfuran-3-yl)methyl phosphate synthase, partial [Methylobacterium trifolii]
MSESVRIPSALPLPRLLVSVRDVAEARAAHAAGADLIDAKDPEAGAL